MELDASATVTPRADVATSAAFSRFDSGQAVASAAFDVSHAGLSGGTIRPLAAPAPAGSTLDVRVAAIEATTPAPGTIADILSRLESIEKLVVPQVQAGILTAETDAVAFAPIANELVAMGAKAKSQGHSITSIIAAVGQQLLGIRL